jgi:AcrR family transcriptional regulator
MVHVEGHPAPVDADLIARCLAAFVQAGTLDLSLDQLAEKVGISKRMLIHYFGSRAALENQAMDLLERQLRAQFAPSNFPHGASLADVLTALWRRTTDPANRGVVLLTMDLSRRAWMGSRTARAFYLEQQRLWVDLLSRYEPDRAVVQASLQSFQGAVLSYLITGDTHYHER